MFWNYLKIALRNLWRDRLYAGLNLLGLCVAIAGSLLIGLYVADQLSYDAFHEDADRIYRVLETGLDEGSSYRRTYTPGRTASRMLKEIPEVEEATRIAKAHSPLVRYRNRALTHDRIVYADTNFFDLFSYEFIAGDPESALRDPFSVVITESEAERFFGDDPVLGNTLTFEQEGRFEDRTMRVTGVIEDPPHTTSYPFGMVISFATYEAVTSPDYAASVSSHSFVRLEEGVEPGAVRDQIAQIAADLYQTPADAQGQSRAGYELQPLTAIHLSTGIQREYIPSGGAEATYLYMLASVALFLVVIACINFMNLATARSARRAAEIGIRKAVGSGRASLVGQHLLEAVLLSAVACGGALLLAEALLPFYEQVAGVPLSFDYLDRWYVVPSIAALGVVVGLIAGSYPALYLTRFSPVEALRDRGEGVGRGGWMRQALVVFQFAISIVLLIATGFVFRQLDYMRDKDLGFREENVLVLDKVDRMGEDVLTFRDELVEMADVTTAGFVSSYPSRVWGFSDQPLFRTRRAARAHLEEESGGSLSGGASVNTFRADDGFIPTLEIDLAAGRNFSEQIRSDSSSIILNRAAVEALGLEEPAGSTIYTIGYRRIESEEGKPRYRRFPEPRRVVGVVENYHYLSLHREIEPVAIFPALGSSVLLARIQPGSAGRTVRQIEELWSEHAPHIPFIHSFLKEDFRATFAEERRFGVLIAGFSGLLTLIACLGIFGLAAFSAQRRLKEIGIRKVLGATWADITGLLTSRFMFLVGSAFVIAVPIGYLAMRAWLRDFAYHVSMGVGIFLLAGLAAASVALVTVAYHALRAAWTNPAETLRYE